MRLFLVAVVCLAVAAAEHPFLEHGLVPDVVDEAPTDTVQVTYSGGVEVTGGNELAPRAVKDQPTYNWPTETGALYTLIMTDPDAVSRTKPTLREFLHFMVVNIPGTDVSKGEVLFEYIGSGPPKDTGLHRYVILVYKQPGHIDFNQAKVSNKSRDNRPHFSARKFAELKNLGKPIAGNFYQAQWDDYVPILHKQLGG